MSANFRLALVGCGAVSEQLHLPAILARSDVRLTAAIDRNEERSRLIADRAGAQAFATVGEALPRFDAAIVALPHHLHAPVSIELLRAGKHVLVEKPMANTTAECEAMIAAAKEGNATLTVGQMRRFCPAVAVAKGLVDRNVIGRIRRFEIREGNIYNWPVTSDFFFRKETAGGGVLLDTGAHTFDMLLWLFGEIAEVEYRDDAFGGVEADCEIRCVTVAGASGYVELSRTRDLPTQLVVEGEDGRLIIDYKKNQLQLRLGRQDFDSCQFPIAHPGFAEMHIWLLMIVRQLDDWITAVREKRPALVSGQEGIKVVEFMERCYRQRRTLVLPWLNPVKEVIG